MPRYNSSYTKQQLLERNALRLAMVLRGIYEETGGSDTRLLTGLLIPDELVEVGRSFAGTDHREHVVPRKVIWTECKRLFDAEAPDEDVLAFSLTTSRSSGFLGLSSFISTARRGRT